MKKSVILTLLALALTFTCAVAAPKNYRITDIHGIVLSNGFILKRGNSVAENDVLSAKRQSIIKVTDSKRSYTLKLQGEQSVKQLIASIPNKYESAIDGIRRNLDKGNRKNVEYGMVTMATEGEDANMSPYDLRENEAVAICKEDSVGELMVIFMRYGMEKPMKYHIAPITYNYLLRMDIVTAKGFDYAYNTPSVYNELWKPIEWYVHKGDTLIFSIVPYLSDIDMGKIKVDDDTTMGDMFQLFQIDDTDDR